jgi:hypothetical protein
MNLEDVGRKIGGSMDDFVMNSVWWSVANSVWNSVWNSVYNPVWNFVRNSVYDGIKLPIRVERKRR